VFFLKGKNWGAWCLFIKNGSDFFCQQKNCDFDGLQAIFGTTLP